MIHLVPLMNQHHHHPFLFIHSALTVWVSNLHMVRRGTLPHHGASSALQRCHLRDMPEETQMQNGIRRQRVMQSATCGWSMGNIRKTNKIANNGFGSLLLMIVRVIWYGITAGKYNSYDELSCFRIAYWWQKIVSEGLIVVGIDWQRSAVVKANAWVVP